MTAALLVQLLVQFGPGAIHLVENLMSVWTKPSLSPEEVATICSLAKKSYEEYMEEGNASK